MKIMTKNKSTHYSLYIVAIVFLLVAVFIGIVCLERPAIVNAASNKQYISEIRVFEPALGSYDAEAKKLTDEGYKIDTASNLLQGYSDQTMNLAYKTTTDPKQAITDFSVMNMKGPYSFAGYEDLIEDTKLFADERISHMASGIREFKKNYSDGAPAAKYAYKMMNKYREVDSNKLVGDFLLSTSSSRDVSSNVALRDMVMQADPIILTTIDKYLAIGSAPANDEKSWIEKLSELSPKDIGDAKGNPGLEQNSRKLMEAIMPIARKLKKYHEFYKRVLEEFSATTEAEIEEMLKDPIIKARFDDLVNNNFVDDETKEYESSSMMYMMLSSYKYENDKSLNFAGKQSLIMPEVQNGSVLDLFFHVLENKFLIPELYPMASVLTEAQVDMMYISGMETSIMICDNDKKLWEETTTDLASLEIDGMKIDEVPIISVYEGVDRTIYNPDGIALTDDAARRQFVDKEDTWYANNLDETAEWILRGVLGVSAIAFVGMSIRLGMKIYSGIYQPSMVATGDATSMALRGSEWLSTSGSKAQYAQASSASKCKDIALSSKWSISGSSISRLFRVAFGVVMFVLIAVVTVYLILELVEYFKEPVYTEKPRIIFHNFSNSKGNSVYVRYDAVVNQNKTMTDVRNRNSKQWVVLYTSKDKEAGNPILADSIKFSYNRMTSMPNYSPVHRISETKAYNLQDGKNVSVYFQRDANAFPRSASSFSAGALTIALCGGILGGLGLGFLATWFIMNKKRKSEKLIAETKIG